MIDFWIGPLFTITCVGLYTAYWVWRLNREHRERMTLIDAEAAADAVRFEAMKKDWSEARARADAEHKEIIEAGYRDFLTPRPPAGSELTITMTLSPPTPADGPVEVARIRIPISASHPEAQVDRAIAAFDQVGKQLAAG